PRLPRSTPFPCTTLFRSTPRTPIAEVRPMFPASFARLLRASALGLAALTLAAPAWAQADAWPSRPLTMVVPFPPGSSPDTLARMVAEPLAEKLGQPVVVENKPGAGGNIGTRQVAKAKPDGYTLLLTINGPIVTAPALYKTTLGYDPD